MKKIFGKTTLILGFCICFSLLLIEPNQVQAAGDNPGISPEAQQLIDDVYAATIGTMQERAAEAGQTIETVSATIQENIDTIRAASEYLDTISDAWTDETWNRFMDIFKQAGVAVDELIPSVSGCIHDENGNPMKGVLVAMIPMAKDSQGGEIAMLPSLALTGNGTIEQHPGNHSSFGFSAGLPTLPVSDSFLPESYRDKFNQGGCYLVPVPPQLMKIYFESLVAAAQLIEQHTGLQLMGGALQEVTFSAIIHPMFPGYNMGPYEQKIVFKAGGVAEITNMDTGATRTVRAQ